MKENGIPDFFLSVTRSPARYMLISNQRKVIYKDKQEILVRYLTDFRHMAWDSGQFHYYRIDRDRVNSNFR